MNDLDKELLKQVADIEGELTGAYNIRKDGKLVSRNVSSNINIVSKTDKPGIDIFIADGTKNESLHIPVIVTEAGFKDLVSSSSRGKSSVMVTTVPLPTLS